MIEDRAETDIEFDTIGITGACGYRLCHPNVVPMETAEPSD